MTEHDDERVLARIQTVRARNLALFAEMASLLSVDIGWVRRDPDAPDPTLNLIRHALAESPTRTRVLLHKVAANDAEVVRLTEDLANG